MPINAKVENQISNAISEAGESGGEDALAVIAELLTGIAQSLSSAKDREAAIDYLSTSLENAEAALHGIIAGLVVH